MNKRKLHQSLEAIQRIARRHGATRLRLFGSVARDEANPEGDLDLLADFEPRRDLMDVAGLKVDLEELLGCKVDVVEEAALSPYLRDRVLKEAQPL